MIGFARLSEQGSEPKAIVMLPAVRKDYYKKFLGEALPVESHLLSIVHDAFVSEISTSTIENKQDAVDWLTWTYFYRRLATNPAFYGLQNTAHEYVSEFLSDLVESTLNDLIEAKMIEVEDETDISVLNLGLIGAYYSISWITMQTFALSLTEKTKLKVKCLFEDIKSLNLQGITRNRYFGDRIRSDSHQTSRRPGTSTHLRSCSGKDKRKSGKSPSQSLHFASGSFFTHRPSRRSERRPKYHSTHDPNIAQCLCRCDVIRRIHQCY